MLGFGGFYCDHCWSAYTALASNHTETYARTKQTGRIAGKQAQPKRTTGSRRKFVVPWLDRQGPEPEEIESGQRAQMSLALRSVPRELHHLLPLLTDTHNHAAGYNSRERSDFNKEMPIIEALRH